MPRLARTSSAGLGLHVHRHLAFGWWSLLAFLTTGVGLEMLHALKVGWYLNEGYEMRRLLWTLGHAHGTLLGFIHVAVGCTFHVTQHPDSRLLRVASPCLIAASFLLPGGFFLGGIFIYEGDPGIGIFLVPVGAIFLFLGVLLVACTVSCKRRSPTVEGLETRKRN